MTPAPVAARAPTLYTCPHTFAMGDRMLERWIERTLFASRWLLVPLYLGLALVLLLFTVKFFEELVALVPHILEHGEDSLVLATLALVDLTLVANLVIMVMISGYENFVSSMDAAKAEDKLSWVGKLDSGSLKIKVAASIVAISSIHLLKAFMNVETLDNAKLGWLVGIHLTFVASALMMAWLDKIAFASHRDH